MITESITYWFSEGLPPPSQQSYRHLLSVDHWTGISYPPPPPRSLVSCLLLSISSLRLPPLSSVLTLSPPSWLLCYLLCASLVPRKTCEFAHCASSKAVLQHQHLCGDSRCQLCGSVRALSQKCFWANARVSD